ncbi:acetolactate decarboxylase, partial [Enterococcus lactis]|uniref:acetolactate decarboxylase n=1 Tax=Enterococcus lactis TaxID=357441 RepID=UPI001C7CC4D0
YAAITDITQDTSFSVSESADGDQLKKDNLVKEDRENLFLAVKITGIFKHMQIHIMPKQEKPHRRLAKRSESQPEFHQSNIHG